MQVLMLGWEFPPKVTGGLAIATAGLVKALDQAGHHIVLMLPERQMPPPSMWAGSGGKSEAAVSDGQAKSELVGASVSAGEAEGERVSGRPELSGNQQPESQGGHADSATNNQRFLSEAGKVAPLLSGRLPARKEVAPLPADDDDEPAPWPIPPHPLLAVARAWQHSGASAQPISAPHAGDSGGSAGASSQQTDAPSLGETSDSTPTTGELSQAREGGPTAAAGIADRGGCPEPAGGQRPGTSPEGTRVESGSDTGKAQHAPAHRPEFTPPVWPNPEDQQFAHLPRPRSLPVHADVALQSLPVIVPDPYSSRLPAPEAPGEAVTSDPDLGDAGDLRRDPLRPIGFLGGLVVGDSRHGGVGDQAGSAAAAEGPASEADRWQEGDAGREHRGGHADRSHEPDTSHGDGPSGQAGQSSDEGSSGNGQGAEPPLPPGVSRLRWLPGDQTTYEGDLFKAVAAYAVGAVEASRHESFEVIHAHDWLTMPAAAALAAIHGCPMVLHVHSTEFDRSPEGPDPRIVAIERRGMLAADRVIAVSNQTRQTLIKRYGVPARRIVVVHNAVEPVAGGAREPRIRFEPADRLVTFIGRITSQKGPQFFVEAARRVLAKERGVKFVMAGTGDLVVDMIERVAREGMGGRFVFTGFLSQEEVGQLLDRSDVFVLTSVHEPFGLTPLEAARRQVPVIVSRKAGVSEVLKHTLKVDHWNPEDIADKVLAVLRRPALSATMRREAELEVRRLTWDQAAARCTRLYRDLLRKSVLTLS